MASRRVAARWIGASGGAVDRSVRRRELVGSRRRAGAMFQPGATPFGPADLSSVPLLRFAAHGAPAAYQLQLFCRNTAQEPPTWPLAVADDGRSYEVDLAEVGGCDTAGNLYLTTGLGTDPLVRDTFFTGSGLGMLWRGNQARGTIAAVADLAGYERDESPDGRQVDSNPYGLLANRPPRPRLG